MFVKLDFSDLELMVPTLLKTKEHCHLWFHEEPLLSMEPFNCKKGSLDFFNVLHSKKKVVILRTNNGSSMASLQKSYLEPLFLRVHRGYCECLQKKIYVKFIHWWSAIVKLSFTVVLCEAQRGYWFLSHIMK